MLMAVAEMKMCVSYSITVVDEIFLAIWLTCRRNKPTLSFPHSIWLTSSMCRYGTLAFVENTVVRNMNWSKICCLNRLQTIHIISEQNLYLKYCNQNFLMDNFFIWATIFNFIWRIDVPGATKNNSSHYISKRPNDYYGHCLTEKYTKRGKKWSIFEFMDWNILSRIHTLGKMKKDYDFFTKNQRLITSIRSSLN